MNCWNGLQRRSWRELAVSQMLWLVVAMPVYWPLMANASMAAPPSVPGTAVLDQQLLAHAADAPAEDVKKLIERGAHVNAQDRFGVTPLMEAVIGNNPAVARVLLDAGASMGIRNLRGDTALDLARQLGRREIEQLLLQARVSRVNPRLLTRHGNWR